jgi:acyl-CoA synthetase (AMP-forming)/AMP-acid ligase II
MSGVPLKSIRDVWYHNLEKFPGKTAVTFGEGAWTYHDCDLLSDRLRRAFAERFGFRPGDRVAIAAPHCFEYYVAYWAIVKSGGVVVPVNTRLAKAELAHILARSEARLLFVHTRSWPAMREAIGQAGTVEHVVGIDLADQGVTPFADLTADGEGWDFHPEIGEGDLAIIMHTSGTTGRPKGAMMRHCDLLFNNKLAVYAHSLRHEDVHLLVVPMFHATALYSLLPTSAMLGSTVVIAERTDVRYLAEVIDRRRVTTFFGVPMMFGLLTQLPDLADFDLSSLRVIAYAGSPMPVGTILKLRELFPGVMLHNFFGLTETISMTHVLPSCDATTHPESIGKLLPQVSQRILDAEGNEVAPGIVGRLHLHRSDIICGYWKDPDRLEQSMHGDWFDTGDLASVDEDGYTYVKGRSKDMVIVGGENVYALEVEQCLMAHEGVLEAAVVGVPATGVRAHLGELVKAFVVPQPGAKLTEQDVRRHCAERLATYKVPAYVELRDALPRNPTGKVLKRELEG